MRAKDNLCPETGAQCYVPDCTDARCDFQEPDKAREEGYMDEHGTFVDNTFLGAKNYPKQMTIIDHPQPDPVPQDPALETRVENTEKAVTDLYWQLKQLKEKWEGKKE